MLRACPIPGRLCDVLRRISSGDPVWESMVPLEVGELIKRRGFFGYQRSEAD